MADRERGRQLLSILKSVHRQAVETVSSESPGFFDRVALVARLNLPLRLFIEDPAARSLAKIGAARSLASVTYFTAQREWFVSGQNDELADRDPKLAEEIATAYFALNAALRDAIEAENRWYKLPEHIIDAAVTEFFSGLLETLERWINFVAKPFGIPWDLIILGVGAVLVVTLFRSVRG